MIEDYNAQKSPRSDITNKNWQTIRLRAEPSTEDFRAALEVIKRRLGQLATTEDTRTNRVHSQNPQRANSAKRYKKVQGTRCDEHHCVLM